MRIVLTGLVLLLAGSLFAEKQPYERYQPIVDRQMFGPLPDDFDPTKLPSEVERTRGRNTKELTKEQEQVKKAIRFSVLNQTPSGELQVGFTDNANPKTPKNYYLKVGESQDGWTVREADLETAQMTIVNAEGIEVTLTLGGDSATDTAAVSRTSNQPRSAGAGRSSLLSGGNSLLSRRRRREQEAKEAEAQKAEQEQIRQQAEQERRDREAAEKAEENAKHEAERQEQKKQLLAIQEELRRVREESSNAKKSSDEGDTSE